MEFKIVYAKDRLPEYYSEHLIQLKNSIHRRYFTFSVKNNVFITKDTEAKWITPEEVKWWLEEVVGVVFY